MTITEFLDKKDLCKSYNEIKKYYILNKFSDWITEEDFSNWHLSLFPFSYIKPLSYFKKDVVTKLLSYLLMHKQAVLKIMFGNDNKITHAISSMLRNGTSWQFEEPIKLDNPEDYERFESIWHPEYLRYYEHIYHHLMIVPMAIFDSKTNGSSEDIDKLKNSNLAYLTSGYNKIIRNSISHGSVRFSNSYIEYRDFHETEKLISYDFAEIFDDLVYDCHSIVIAYLLFLSKVRNKLKKQELKKLPLGIRLLFIKGFAEQRDFTIVSMMDTETQLNFSCKAKMNMRLWHYISSFRTVLKAHDFGAEKYSRFAISIDFGREISSLFVIDGEKFRLAISENFLVGRMHEVFEKTLTSWYDLKIKNFRYYFLKEVLKLSYQTGKNNRTKELKKNGFLLLSKRYIIKKYEVIDSDNNRSYVIKAIILDNIFNESLILQILNKILKQAKSKKISKISFRTRKIIKKKPQRIMIHIFRNDLRLRSLNTFYSNPNLLITAEYLTKKWPYESMLKVYNFENDGLKARFNF